MKASTITVRLDREIVPMLDQICRRLRRTRRDIIRKALKRHLAQLRFEELRRRVALR